MSRLQAVVFRPDRTIVRKSLRVDNGTVLNEKLDVGARVNADLVVDFESQGRVIRMRKARRFIGLRQDDGDPISFRDRDKGWRSDSAKMQKADLHRIQVEEQRQANEHGSKDGNQLGLWYPISIAATLGVLFVLVLLALRFWASGGLDKVAGG